jgi:hypothetical protein
LNGARSSPECNSGDFERSKRESALASGDHQRAASSSAGRAKVAPQDAPINPNDIELTAPNSPATQALPATRHLPATRSVPSSAPQRRGPPMKFAHFFIDRPVFAAVLSIVTILVGVIAMFNLPIAQYPEIAPPTVVVTARYPAPMRRSSPTASPRRSSSRSTASRTCCTCPASATTTAASS